MTEWSSSAAQASHSSLAESGHDKPSALPVAPLFCRSSRACCCFWSARSPGRETLSAKFTSAGRSGKVKPPEERETPGGGGGGQFHVIFFSTQKQTKKSKKSCKEEPSPQHAPLKYTKRYSLRIEEDEDPDWREDRRPLPLLEPILFPLPPSAPAPSLYAKLVCPPGLAALNRRVSSFAYPPSSMDVSCPSGFPACLCSSLQNAGRLFAPFPNCTGPDDDDDVTLRWASDGSACLLSGASLVSVCFIPVALTTIISSIGPRLYTTKRCMTGSGLATAGGGGEGDGEGAAVAGAAGEASASPPCCSNSSARLAPLAWFLWTCFAPFLPTLPGEEDDPVGSTRW